MFGGVGFDVMQACFLNDSVVYTREFPVFVTARIGERQPKPQHAWGRATQSPGRSWWMLGKIESVLFRAAAPERPPLHPCTHRH